MSSPWAKIAAPEPVNFADILSEEAAKDMQAKDWELVEFFNLSLQQQAPDISQEPPGPLNDEDGTCDSDEVIARRLQKQLDAEYNDMLKRSENQFNRDSKVSISSSNYGRGERHTDLDSESEDENDLLEEPSEKEYWDRLDNLAKEFSDIPVCGYQITKHDIAMNATRNACKKMDFPSDYQTEEDRGFVVKKPKKVFCCRFCKQYYKYQQREQQNEMNDKKEDGWTTVEFGVDKITRLLLYEMISNNLLERVNGVLSIGKEALILHADGNPTYPHAKINVPKECVLKVFKTVPSESKQRDKYVSGDSHVKDQMGKQTIRTIGFWAKKEMRNLNKLKKAGIPCPEVINKKRHVLVMSFIGEDHKPAPKLKYANLDECEYEDAYNQVVSYMKALYRDARLIHANLSENNILWHNGKCYLIDVSQSTELGHMEAFSFLMRDCENVSNFFASKGVQEVKNAEQLFFDITSCYYNDRVALEVLHNKLKMKPHLMNHAEEKVPLVDPP